MKLIGKNSLLFWLKYPLLIFIIGNIAFFLWICCLILFHLVTGQYNALIAHNMNNGMDFLQFKLPFSEIMVATHNSTEGMLLSLLGLLSICFVLLFSYKIIQQLSGNHIFSGSVVRNFKIMSIGLIICGFVLFVIDMITGSNQIRLEPSLLYVIVGIVMLLFKEIFAQGKALQDQTDLTI